MDTIDNGGAAAPSVPSARASLLNAHQHAGVKAGSNNSGGSVGGA
jgi:hypothetical protein